MRRRLRLFCRLALGDVAPRSHDLQGLAVGAADKMLLVIHPAIGAILAAKPIFHRVDPVLEESSYFGLDAGEIIRVDPVAPEGRILKIFGRGVSKHCDDVVADEGGSEVAGRLEAIDHRRRRTQQSR